MTNPTTLMLVLHKDKKIEGSTTIKCSCIFICLKKKSIAVMEDREQHSCLVLYHDDIFSLNSYCGINNITTLGQQHNLHTCRHIVVCNVFIFTTKINYERCTHTSTKLSHTNTHYYHILIAITQLHCHFTNN